MSRGDACRPWDTAECTGRSCLTTALRGAVAALNDAKSAMAIAAITTHRIASAIGNQFLHSRMAISSCVPFGGSYATGVAAFQPWFQREIGALWRSSARAAGNMRSAHTSYPRALG